MILMSVTYEVTLLLSLLSLLTPYVIESKFGGNPYQQSFVE